MSYAYHQPSRQRDRLLRKLCYDWIRKEEPERFERFRLITEIEFPAGKTGPKPKCRGAQESS